VTVALDKDSEGEEAEDRCASAMVALERHEEDTVSRS